MIVHGGLIAWPAQGRWKGILILGPSGVGKSDLALRALDDGFQLVADDRVALFQSAGRLFGQAPATLRGLMEIRGLGVIPAPARRFAPIILAVRCKKVTEAMDRLPEPLSERLLGLEIPAIDLHPLENSATAKIRRAIEYLGAGA